MLKKMMSLLSKKVEGKSIVIKNGPPIVLRQEMVECSDTIKEPARPFIDMEKFRSMGR